MRRTCRTCWRRAPGMGWLVQFLPLLWVKLAEGKPANSCVGACATRCCRQRPRHPARRRRRHPVKLRLDEVLLPTAAPARAARTPGGGAGATGATAEPQDQRPRPGRLRQVAAPGRRINQKPRRSTPIATWRANDRGRSARATFIAKGPTTPASRAHGAGVVTASAITTPGAGALPTRPR